ncbi:maleylpyruvate isomerase family mycothiol-dependent enzyme [Nocardioides sp. 616]|uniref:maleylpyruvate isomerase family mycothiol-dependent enzyme n=1 Tax=Nocardioides sp. 616 TaxID=2268090 RepID=UPI000CE48DED|nr:maleylpyruvate isomerase family mycothiol-dependent enzyme [Nocardioides sp. 616]
MSAAGPDDEQVCRFATANRLLAAEMFARLDAEQWRTPSLCAGWTVREVAAHLVPPEGGFTVGFLLRSLWKYRLDLDRMVDETAREAAQRPTEELVEQLRSRAGSRLKPPVVGALGPMTDTCIHMRDAARPLGLDVNPEPASWRLALDFLVSKPARRGLVPPDRLAGLRFLTTDQEWTHGQGAEVRGSSEAIAMALSGRSAALADLTGAGLPTLSGRISG